MTHYTRIWPDSVLKRGLVLTGQNLIDLDNQTVGAVNGDDGGSWSPTSQIIIGGKGVRVHAPFIMSGSNVQALFGFGVHLTFGRGDAKDYFSITVLNYAHSPFSYTPFTSYASATPFAGAVVNGISVRGKVKGATLRIPLNVYSCDGKINEVSLNWRVGESHANVPQYVPKMRVIAVDLDGTVFPLRTLDATTDANGFQYIDTISTTGTIYYGSGANKGFTYTTTVNFPLDGSKYQYFVEIIEESGASSWSTTGNLYTGAATLITNVFIWDNRY